MILFNGVRASGNSSSYKDRFDAAHIRISLDMLKTAHRELAFINICRAIQQRFVIDNTNPLRAEGQHYSQVAKSVGFRAFGYYFKRRVRDAIGRNGQRVGAAKIPVPGILDTYKRAEVPVLSKSFDKIFCVTVDSGKGRRVDAAHEQSLTK